MKNLNNLLKCLVLSFLMLITLNISAQQSQSQTNNDYDNEFKSLLIDNSINSNSITKKDVPFGFWDTLLVDAGGALGGAGSVASIIGGATGGAAAFTPVGWGAVALGGVLGGASASVAYSKSAPNTNIKTSVKNRVTKENDEVGEGHNQLIIDFYQSNSTYKNKNIFDKDAFYDFANADKKFSKEAPKLPKKVYDKIVDESVALRTGNTSDVLEYIYVYLPKSIDQKSFGKSLMSISNSKDFDQLISNIESLEKEILSKKLSKLDAFLMNTFFSTMRHSAILW